MKKKTKIGLVLLILLSIFVVTQIIGHVNDDFNPIAAFGPGETESDPEDPGDSPGPSDNQGLTGEEGNPQSNREMNPIGKLKDHSGLQWI
ncbi:MAG: hypothetical protein GF308_05870 [Candidatus Heimdallarchaeota archaeon]|nr:hypothetical protein [Candidatus Heimdallarchaeota archaeon]